MKNGDLAFDTLLERTRPWLRALFRDKGVPRGYDIADLVQMVLMKVFTNFDSYSAEEGSHLRAWISSIASNLLIDLSRKKNPLIFTDFLSGDDDRGPGHEPTAPGPGPRTLTHFSDCSAMIEKCLDDLSPTQRLIWECRVLEGLSFKQISERLGKPVGTLTSYFQRANEKLSASVRASGIAQPGTGFGDWLRAKHSTHKKP